MTETEVSRMIKKIISQVAGISILELEDNQLLREELMLDSLKELEIVARTEVQFGITLNEEKLVSLRTLEDFSGLVVQSLTEEGIQIGRR